MTRRIRRVALLATLPLLASLTACSGGENQDQSAQDATVDNIYDDLGTDPIGYESAGSTGEFNTALQETILSAFEDRTGASVTANASDCGISKLAAQVQANNVTSDVWQFCTPSDYQQAIDQGLLEKIDTSVVPVEDLQDGSYTEYGLDAFQFAIGLMYNTDAFPEGSEPTSITDIFNTDTFPGKRCISNYPQYQGAVEAAMLHSGASAADVYPLDLDTVFAELDTIREDTSYYATAAQGFQDMLTGTCSMGLFANGSAFRIAQDNPDAPLGYTLGDAVATSAPVGIPKGAPHLKTAQALLRFYITDSDSQSAFIEQTSYLPAVLKTAPEIPADATAYALSGDNLERLVQQDDDWWAENVETVLEDWNSWLSK